ncbi:MAG: FdhF/YdeP family oxidoreductase [Cyclobacteriaceae bacterium]
MKRNLSITGDTSFSKLKVMPPSDYAAGLPGIKVALEHVNKESGLFKSLQTLSKMNQMDGFDCPGCAWPDPEDRSKLGEYCENGAKALAEEATDSRVSETFFKTHSVEQLSQWTDYEIGKSGRITRPFVLKPDSVHYEPIEWQEAYELIAEQLHLLDSPDEAIFYTSGRSSNEAAFLYGLFARQFGTNNMPDCSNMCHESSGVALKETLGIGKGSVTLDDLPDAEVILIIGQNPGTNHPRMLTSLEKCKKNGGKIITVNPLEEAGLKRFKNPQSVEGWIGSGTPLTDIHLPVKINQDVSLIMLFLKRLLTLENQGQNVFDQDFIQRKTVGFDELIQDLSNYDERELLTKCGVDEKLIDQAVELLANKSKIIICWAMGLTQHKNAVDNIRECVNLLLLKGSIGKKGAGTCPVRGHSNVQGDRTVGIMHYVSKELNQSLEKVFDFKPPAHHGLDTVGSIQAMHAGKAKVFIALGGNFLSAASDTAYTARALQNCDLTVSVTTKLNRTHLITGKTALILPTLGRSETDTSNGQKRYVTVENSMGKVHRSQGVRQPPSEQLRSEPEIVAGIAHAYFKGLSSVKWQQLGGDYNLIREKISQVISGFQDYSAKSNGTGFYLPNNARSGDFSVVLGGKAKFSVCPLPVHELDQDEFMLMTIRSHDQFNTTIYGLDDRYRGIKNERRVLFMNPDDMEKQSLKKEQVIHLESCYDGHTRRAENFKVIPYKIPKQNLAAYFPETNMLVPINHFSDGSRTPISKSVVVRIIR